MKKKLLFIAPHLSTGGMPQYLVKQIESILSEFEVYCVEWENITGGVLVVQRNRVVSLLGDRLITLGTDKHKLIDTIKHLNPDIVHLQEIPELFMDSAVANLLYKSDRHYAIIETSHDSSFDTSKKIYIPDKFLMVSQYQVNQYKALNVPCHVVEYPIEKKLRTKNRENALRDLGLDPNIKHVINVGLFTPRKNQAEIIEYARMLENYPIQFHFIGNQADNFKFYWEPLMQNFPKNCKWWNERSDVDSFYEAADLFLFTSRGHEHDKETMPLVIRESIGWNMPSLIYNLPVYLDYFNKFDNIQYLNFDSLQINASKILDVLGITTKQECIIISTYPNTTSITEVTKQSIESAKRFKLPIILVSHRSVPKELSDIVDYVIVDNNNILTTHTYYNKFWYTHSDFYAEVNLTTEQNNKYHGPAVYTNYYNGIHFAKSMGFKVAYCWNFDMNISTETPLIKARTALQSKEAFINAYTAEEGPCLRTVWFAIKTDFFTTKFPQITNEQEYNTWVKNVGSESNGLENLWYHTLKRESHQLSTISEQDFYSLFTGCSINTNSQVEYATVLPIENNSEEAIIWYYASNMTDSRMLNVLVNDVVIDTVAITSNTAYHKRIRLVETYNVKFEIIDKFTNEIVSTKLIKLTGEYIQNKLKHNGIFKV